MQQLKVRLEAAIRSIPWHEGWTPLNILAFFYFAIGGGAGILKGQVYLPGHQDEFMNLTLFHGKSFEWAMKIRSIQDNIAARGQTGEVGAEVGAGDAGTTVTDAVTPPVGTDVVTTTQVVADTGANVEENFKVLAKPFVYRFWF